MTLTTTNDVRQGGLSLLSWTRGLFTKVIDSIPEDQRMFQPCEGANHAVWQLGHIALVDDLFRCRLADADPVCPIEWKELFGVGSEPSADASIYAPWDTMRETLDASRAALRHWFEIMDEDQLARPLPEELQGFAESHAMLASTIAAHESLHAGQIMMMRKQLNLSRLFM